MRARRLSPRDDEHGAGQRNGHADDLPSIDGFEPAHQREEQHRQRRHRHDQRQIDRRGRGAGEIDRPAADEHAEKAGRRDAEPVLAQQARVLAQRRHDQRRKADRDDRPAEERDRERRHRARDAARQNHVGDLRRRQHEEAEQAQRLCALDWMIFREARSCWVRCLRRHNSRHARRLQTSKNTVSLSPCRWMSSR